MFFCFFSNIGGRVCALGNRRDCTPGFEIAESPESAPMERNNFITE